jgi:hypothetical protein
MLQARGRVTSMHGSDATYARRLHVMLSSRGLKDVGIEGHISSWRGGTAGAKLEKANFLQSRAEILETGMVTAQEFAEALKLIDDPEWVRISLLMISAWGRKP